MKTNSPPDSSRVVSPVAAVVDVDRLERDVAVHGGHLGSEHHADVGAGSELVDEVARHALLELVAAAKDRHAPCVVREEERGLACRVPRPDDVDIQPVGVRSLAARRAVGDALPDEPVEALDRQVPPRDTAGEHDRPRLQDVAAVEVQMAPGRVDPGDRPGDEDLGTEPAGLLQRPGRQLVARHSRRKAEVVLDPRRRAGLAARRLPLDHDRSQSFRGPVHRGGEPRRAAADDDRVVLRCLRPGWRARVARPPDAAQVAHGLPVDDANDRVVLLRRQGAAPLIGGIRRIGRDPSERDLVAVEEPPQLGARRVPAVADHDRARRRRLGRDALQPTDPLPRQRTELDPHFGRRGGDRVVFVCLEPNDA